jgi:gamma-glutamyltranspeptidase/glutathione hydrolase
MEKLIQPAIDLAEKGFAITEQEANLLNNNKEFPEAQSVFYCFCKRYSMESGDLLVQKDLAETLKLIQKQGLKGFYEGKTAELLVSEMKKGNGIITSEDLKNYKVAERKALEFDYKGNQLFLCLCLQAADFFLRKC